MRQALRASSFVPPGFVVDGASADGEAMMIAVRAPIDTGACPGCGTKSARVHSRYSRRLADLPMAGRPVRLVVMARRFYCDAILCGRRIFVERFPEDVLAPWARRTARLENWSAGAPTTSPVSYRLRSVNPSIQGPGQLCAPIDTECWDVCNSCEMPPQNDTERCRQVGKSTALQAFDFMHILALNGTLETVAERCLSRLQIRAPEFDSRPGLQRRSEGAADRGDFA